MPNKFITADLYPLKFSTKAVQRQFQLKEGLPFAPEHSQIKVFGLDSGEDFDTSISELYKFAGFPLNSKPLFDANVTLVHPDETKSETLHRRNAVWYIPGVTSATVMRLSFRLSEMVKLNEFFQGFLGDEFIITSGNVTVRKRTRYVAKKDIWNDSSEIIMDLTGSIFSIEAKITSVFSRNGREMTLIVDFDNSGGIGKIGEWLQKKFGVPGHPKIPDVLGSDGLSLRRIALLLNPKRNGRKCFSASVTFRLSTSFGRKDGKKALFFFTFSWPENMFKASLFPGIEKDDYKFFDPEYEPYRAPAYGDGEVGGLDLNYFTSGQLELKNILPTITSAALVISSDRIRVSGGLMWKRPESSSSSLPVLKFDRISLLAEYNINSKSSLAYLGVSLQLCPPPHKSLPPVNVSGSIAYFSGKPSNWIFGFDLTDVHLSTLYSFFDNDVGDGVVDMLENVQISFLRMKYVYSALPSFTLSGEVLLGKSITARCDYKHEAQGAGSSWTFDIKLGLGPGITVATIMRSILGDVFLPDCVGNIGGAPEDIFSVSIFSVTVSPVKKYVVFHGKFNLGELSFSFVQLRRAGKEAAISTKRVLKISVHELPDIEVNLVGKLPPLFDEMAFQWVDDKGKGLTREEVEFLNTHTNEQIKFKEPKQEGSKGKPEDLVLEKGLHFLIALFENGRSKVILDHRFGSTKKKNPPSTTTAPPNDNDRAADSGETSMAPMAKKLGPLSISNIGLQFDKGILYIVLDATFELGPLELSLLGFRLGAKFEDIRKLPSIKVDLQGLAVGFNKPPLTLAGLFRQKDKLYMGGIIVGFVPYSLTAVGFYGEMGTFKTVFVFAKLEGPLAHLGFAEISGVCGGFGYNNTIGYPTIDQVSTYPFIKNEFDQSNPGGVLQSLVGEWVQPKEKVNWFVVGMTVRAFNLLDVDAVVVVTVTPSVKLGIFAVCAAGFPAKAEPKKRILFVRLGIAAVIDFNAGTMKIEGQLTPDSYVLSPSCHLTGGFGLFYWFGDNKNAGDWVFSIGGFHPSYLRPVHYPNPPRLGISWQVDSTLSVIGESYFAITPKCCMAGARIHAALSLGPLGAWFDASVNLLINFDPFWFMGDVSVSVGVSFTLRLWICTLYIKVEIGADLRIQGPPFSGTAHVKFWVFGFDVSFGAKREDPPGPAEFSKFLEMCFQDKPLRAGLSTSPFLTRRRSRLHAAPVHTDADAKRHILVVSSGLLPTSPKSGPWDVRGGIFSFMIQGRFAIRKAILKSSGAPDVPVDGGSFYAKPMQLKSPIDESTMTILITKDASAEHNILAKIDRWQMKKVEKDVPDALWGQYDEKENPMEKGNQIDGLLNPTTIKITLMMGVTVLSPKPELANDHIKKFNFIHAMAQDVFAVGDVCPETKKRPTFPDYEKVVKDFEPDAPERDTEGKVKKEQWQKVKDKWDTEDAKTMSKSVFDNWSKIYEWKVDPDLSPLPPKLAVKDFLSVYMSAPLMCAA